MSSRRQMLEFLSLSRLPAEFQEVEFIESTGTQYIDTGVVANNNTTLEVKGCYIERIGSAMAGAREGTTSRSFVLNAGQSPLKFVCGYANDRYLTGKYYDGNVHIFKLDKNKYYEDNVLQHTFTVATFTAYSIHLFGCNQKGTSSIRSSSRIYYCKIWSNGELKRDLIPCYRKSDSAIGMYDLINDVFYTNADTGTFIKGNDV